MNYKYCIKRIFSILLCFLIVFTTIFPAFPTEMLAADTTTYKLQCRYGTNKIFVYKGAPNIYMGDLVSAQLIQNANSPNPLTYDLGYLSELEGVTYKSSKPSVISVNKVGLLNIKKTGSAVITLKYKGKKAKITLHVLTKKALMKKLPAPITYMNPETGEYITAPTPAAIEKSAKAVLKKMGVDNLSFTFNDSNRYKMLSAYKDYSPNNESTFVQDPQSNMFNLFGTYYISSPSAIRANLIYNKISQECNMRNPFATNPGPTPINSDDVFKIKSISGKAKSKTFTVTLTKKVTENQILSAMWKFRSISKIKKKSTFSFPILVQNTSTGKTYKATATIKKNSAKMTIKLKNHKMKKGNSYVLVSDGKNNLSIQNWLDVNKKTFKAK